MSHEGRSLLDTQLSSHYGTIQVITYHTIILEGFFSMLSAQTTVKSIEENIVSYDKRPLIVDCQDPCVMTVVTRESLLSNWTFTLR